MLRRRGIIGDNSGGSSAPSYITDGLIFHLDGIDKGSNSGYWTDLINGICKFDISQYCTIDDKSITTDGVHALLGNVSSLCSNYALDILTAECCCRHITKINGGIIVNFGNVSNNSNQMVIGWDSDAYIYRANWVPKAKYEYSNYVDVSSVSLCVSNGCYNGNAMVTVNSSIGGKNGTVVSLGGRANNTVDAMETQIYSVRLYNRNLTFDEMLNNQRADNIRFNLGLTI